MAKTKKFAIIKTGGKQYKVSEGDKLKVEKLPKGEGKDVTFKEVLLYVDGRGVDVGTPTVSGVSVTGRVKEHGKRDKVIVYKYKRRKRQRTKKGHRQPYTEVEITEIKKESGGSKSSTKKSTSKKTTKKKTAAKKKPAAKKKTATKKKATKKAS